MCSEGEGWEKIRIDASMCPRITPHFLESERRSMPRMVFAAEYLCEFAEVQDAVFLYDDVQACLVSPGSITSWVDLKG